MTEKTQAPADALTVDYDLARAWLSDEGYSRDDLKTAEQLRGAAREVLAEGERRAEVGRDVLDWMDGQEAAARYRNA
ncbi:hypothetical protein IDZ74_29350 [Pseudomonas aeruginosa]|uniref:hypothetical protein n=1 Tax=Pseudomonas aeruginosa TaxID=287 RepID=UPI001ADAD5CC|nr:hypothetical protein [Pseudomonas aeruginosa]MBO8406753.1 hypothetical protein [Pseudomonas aeruginosa]